MSDDTGDNITRDEIRAALDGDPRLSHPAQVAVSVRGGRATLRGSLPALHERRAAVEIAQSIPGVHAVEDQLSIDLLDRWDDDQIRGAALQALMSTDNVPDDRIDVAVADGWLTLKGEVKHQSESDAAFEAVTRLAGVGGVTNRIVVITAGLDG